MRSDCVAKRAWLSASLETEARPRAIFYEAMNMAGVWRAPVVFVINNNQWAISAPRSIQTAAQTLAQKGDRSRHRGSPGGR